MTHRDLCVLAAQWARRQRWADLAGYEVQVVGGIADVLAVTDPRRVPVCAEHAARSAEEAALVREAYVEALVAQRRANPSRATADALRSVQRTVPPVLPVRNREPAPRVVAIEVKRTRSDLLSDLRRGKMLRYEAGATHCYLAVTPQVLLLEHLPGRALVQAAIEDLHGRGLPSTWGVIQLPSGHGGMSWDLLQVVHRARPIQDPTPYLVWDAAWTLAHSLSNRVTFLERL